MMSADVMAVPGALFSGPDHGVVRLFGFPE